MFKIKYTPSFYKQLKKLPDDIKKKLSKTLTYIEKNPFHNSLYTKLNMIASTKLHTKVFESRINSKYRILRRYDGEKIILLLTISNHEIVEHNH